MDERAEARLRAATTLAALEALFLIAVVVTRSGLSTWLLVLAIALKLPCCWLARRRHPGGFLAVLLWEGIGLIVALTAPRIAVAVRIIEVSAAVAVIALLVGSVSVFPSPELPER
jgi:hypothetical protein